MTTVFERRCRDCQHALADAGADAAVLFPSPNCYYVSGFDEEPSERHLLLFVPREGDPVFVVPELYRDQVAEESWVEDVRSWADGEDPTHLVRSVLADRELTDGRLLVDDRMWARFTLGLQDVAPDAEFGLASEVFDDLRIRKDDAEIDALRRAGELADEVSEEVRALGAEAVGMTERELAAEIDDRLSAGGGEGTSFDTLVGSGPNGAKPHHRHGDREIRPGDPVVLDFGARVDGYPGDQTRTVVFDGEPSAAFLAAYETVREAQEAAVEAIEPGVPAEEIDAIARGIIEDAGFGEQFIHRTGHGVGLEVHEHPNIVAGNDTPLEPGMVFSVEPGVYVPGEFGVRIEDLVVVTEDGCERLNDSPRTWKPL
jgi:Xaa-Pro aminopeptidase